jgi:hypothetical protein
MNTNEMEVKHQRVTLQRQPWETPQIDAAAVALSTEKDANLQESLTDNIKNGS